MKIRVALACAWLSFAVLSPASAATPYQASVPNPSCVGNSSCTVTFSKIGGIHYAIISHVSCRVATTQGNQGIYYAALQSSASTAPPDYLPISYVFNLALINVPTLYEVAAGTSPEVTMLALGGVTFIAPNSTVDQPTCFVSGYTY